MARAVPRLSASERATHPAQGGQLIFDTEVAAFLQVRVGQVPEHTESEIDRDDHRIAAEGEGGRFVGAATPTQERSAVQEHQDGFAGAAPPGHPVRTLPSNRR